MIRFVNIASFTEAEDRRINAEWTTRAYQDIAVDIMRPKASVYKRAVDILGLKFADQPGAQVHRPFDDEMDRILREVLRDGGSYRGAAKCIGGVSADRCATRAKLLGLTSTAPRGRSVVNDDAIIRQFWPTTPVEEIAKALNHSAAYVISRISAMGVSDGGAVLAPPKVVKVDEAKPAPRFARPDWFEEDVVAVATRRKLL